VAVGIYANNTGTISNSGAIDVTSGYQAAGIGANNTGAISNSGDITVTAAEEAAGIYAENIDGGISNSAGISASANAADGISADTTGTVSNTIDGVITAIGEWWAAGIHAIDTGAISNEGTISATANSESEAVTAKGIAADTSQGISNSGMISATAQTSGNYVDAEAVGIDAKYVTGNISNTVDASIIADATSTKDSAEAKGIDASYVVGDISNDGSIAAKAQVDGFYDEAEAKGIDAYRVNGTITNSGSIDALAIALKESEAEAIGVDVVQGSGNVVNAAGGSIDAHAVSARDDAMATGIYVNGLDGSISNEGAVTVQADVNGTGDLAEAKGIYAEDMTGTITNAGSLTVQAAASGDSRAKAFGIEAYRVGDITNTGSINATAESNYYEAWATGINTYIYDDYDDFSGNGYSSSWTGSIRNEGQIVASANAVEDAYAYGIDAQNAESIVNTASGSIQASAYAEDDATATGIYLYQYYGPVNFTMLEEDDSYPSNSIINEGLITAEATASWAYASGIEGYGVELIGNAASGSIQASAYAEEGYATATGIYLDQDHSQYPAYLEATTLTPLQKDVYYPYGWIINEGLITAEATGSSAYASGIEGYGVELIDNAGTIEVTAMSNEPSVPEMSIQEIMPDAEAYGIYAAGYFYDDSGDDGDNESQLLLTNGNGDYRPRVVNTGNIYMDAQTGAGIAIHSGSWDVYNPGFIYTSNDVRTLSVGNAWDYKLDKQLNGHGAYARLVDDFRIIFNGDPEGEEDAYVPQILVGYDGYLDLNDATLVAQAGESIVWNTPYRVIENRYEYEYYDEELEDWVWVSTDENIIGEFAALNNPNPNINVSWVDSDETGADAEVIFGYDPQGSAPGAGMRLANLGAIQNSNLIQQRSFSQLLAKHIKTQQDTLLADSGTTASDAGFLVARSGDNLENAMFIRPYAKAIDRSTSGGMGYDGNIYGFVLGYERSLSPELTLGAHAGIGFGTLDFKGDGFSDNDEDQTIYSLGVHAAYNPDAWHFDGSATFYVAEHEYDGKTGNFLEIDESDDYTSYGAEVEVIGGYVIPSGDWAVMPYAGLGYSWINADSHTTDADDPAWDTKFGSVDEHIVRSILGAQLSGNLMWGETRVVPSLGARWEYALTDNNIEVSQSLLGSPSVTAEDDISRSSFIADASLGLSKGALSFELGGTAEYNDDYDAYGGWLTLRYAF
jgi:hypothetical protein